MWLSKTIQNAKQEIQKLDQETKLFNSQNKGRMHNLPAHLEKSYYSVIDRKVRVRSWLEKATVIEHTKKESGLARVYSPKHGPLLIAA